MATTPARQQRRSWRCRRQCPSRCQAPPASAHCCIASPCIFPPCTCMYCLPLGRRTAARRRPNAERQPLSGSPQGAAGDVSPDQRKGQGAACQSREGKGSAPPARMAARISHENSPRARRRRGRRLEPFSLQKTTFKTASTPVSKDKKSISQNQYDTFRLGF